MFTTLTNIIVKLNVNCCYKKKDGLNYEESR